MSTSSATIQAFSEPQLVPSSKKPEHIEVNLTEVQEVPSVTTNEAPPEATSEKRSSRRRKWLPRAAFILFIVGVIIMIVLLSVYLTRTRESDNSNSATKVTGGTTANSTTLLVSTSITSTSTSSTSSTITTTFATTITITSNVCTLSWSGISLIYHCDNCPDIAPYTQYNYTYVAISNQTRISFAFREDIGCFALDAVSVRNVAAPATELIINGGFETGTLSSWTYCNPNGAVGAGAVYSNSNNLYCLGYTFTSEAGSYYYYDGAVGNTDYLFQTFATNIGDTYIVSYWLYNRGSGSQSSADILLSI